ncbi:MAG TPA: hypothetical protein VGS19_04380 [Streptosporangiaceae bacterium]|nr:hypothetical protein [Streptosporangiaceae bacterium]
MRRRLSALSSFYRYAAAHDLIGRIPTEGVSRSVVDPTTPPPSAWTVTRPAPWSPRPIRTRRPGALRSVAVVRLLLHNALRVHEACGADIADLAEDRGHRVLGVLGKGNRKAKIRSSRARAAPWHLPRLAPARRGWRGRGLSGPLLATPTGGPDAPEPPVGPHPPPGPRRGHPRYPHPPQRDLMMVSARSASSRSRDTFASPPALSRAARRGRSVGSPAVPRLLRPESPRDALTREYVEEVGASLGGPSRTPSPLPTTRSGNTVNDPLLISVRSG